MLAIRRPWLRPAPCSCCRRCAAAAAASCRLRSRPPPRPPALCRAAVSRSPRSCAPRGHPTMPARRSRCTRRRRPPTATRPQQLRTGRSSSSLGTATRSHSRTHHTPRSKVSQGRGSVHSHALLPAEDASPPEDPVPTRPRPLPLLPQSRWSVRAAAWARPAPRCWGRERG